MKNYYFLLALLSVPAHAQNFDAPDFSAVTQSVQELSTDTGERFLFDPVLSVNSNRGAFSTSIAIALPPSLLGGAGLSLDYNSESGTNSGMGVGWSWNLPEISVNPKLSEKAPYLISGSLGSGELTATQESGSAFTAYATEAFQSVKNQTPMEWTVYRPLLEEKFTAFLQASDSNHQVLGWVAIATDGQRFVFQGNGQLLGVVNREKSAILYSWSSGLLRSIRESVAGKIPWRADLGYTAELQPLEQYTPDGFARVPFGLKNITLTLSSGKSKIYDFQYQDQFLISATIRGGHQALFQGSYLSPTLKSVQTANEFRRNDDLTPIRNGVGEGIFGVKSEPDPELLSYYTDLNGDGRTDRIVFDRRLEKAALVSLYVNCSHRAPFGGTQQVYQDTQPPGQVEMRVNHGGNLQWDLDRSLEIPSEIKPYRNVMHEKASNECGPIKSIPHALFFVDINGDGRKDIVDCGEDEDTTAIEVEIDNDPVGTTGLDGKPVISKRKLSNTALGALSVLGSPLAAGKSFTNPFQVSGKVPLLYLQQTSDQAVAQWLNQTQSTYAQDVSFPVGMSKWKKTNSGFQCHKGSLFFDANHDGHLDVLTGNTLYLGSSWPGNYKAITVNPADFLKLGADALDLTDPQMILIDRDGSGKFEVKQARALMNNAGTGWMELIQNGTTESFTPAPVARKLLSKMYSSFGGNIEIAYDFIQGAWAPVKVKTVPGGKQLSFETVYEYFGSMIDPIRGLFIGFSSTRETRQMSRADVRVAPRVLERKFYADLDPLASMFSSRARLNGRALSILRKNSIGASAAFVAEETSYELGATALGNGRLFAYNETSDQKIFRSQSNLVADRKKTKLILPADPSLWANDSFGNKILPLQTTTDETGMGIGSSQNDSLLERRLTTASKSKWISDKNLLIPEFRKVRDRDLKQYRADTQFTFDSNQILKQICRIGEEKRCSDFSFDSLGRLTSTKTSDGKFMQATYDEQFPLPKTLTSNAGVESRTYSELSGSIENQVIPEGAIYHRDYSPDGILFRVQAAENQVTLPVTVFELDDANLAVCAPNESPCQVKPSIEVSIFDRSETWVRDGIGRIQDKIVHQTVTEPLLKTSNRYFAKLVPELTRSRDLNSGFLQFGFNREVIARNSPSFTTDSSSELAAEKSYDGLGRLIHQEEMANESKERSFTDMAYDGNCTVQVLNGTLKSSECKDLFGAIQSQASGSERLTFDMSSDGTLLGVPELNESWKSNLHSEVTESIGAEWILNRRSIETLEQGTKYTDSYGYTYITDALGLLVSAQKDAQLAKSMSDSDVWDQRTYQGLHLIQQKLSLLTHPGQPYLTQLYRYSGFGKISEAQSNQFLAHYSQDQFGRTSQVDWSKDGGSNLAAQYSYAYENGAQSGLILGTLHDQGYAKLERDELNRVKSVRFANGLVMERSYFGQSARMKSIQVVSREGKVLFSELFQRNDAEQIIGRVSTSQFNPVGSPKAGIADTFAYDPNQYQLLKPNRTLIAQETVRKRDGRVAKIGMLNFAWSGEYLSRVGERTFFYDGEGTWSASCEKGYSTTDTSHCILRLDADHYLNQGELVSLYRIDGIPVAVLEHGKVYPVIIDSIGSLRAEVSEDGSSLRWERHFGAWGEKTISAASADAEQSERKILWSFAHLMEQPGVESSPGHPLYWSNTRVYSAELGEWMSVDPSVKWNPNLLLKKPGNWFAVRYAGNRPLDYVDESGQWIHIAVGAAIGAGLNYRSGAAAGLSGTDLAKDVLCGATMGAVSAGIPVIGGAAAAYLATAYRLSLEGAPPNQIDSGANMSFLSALIGGAALNGLGNFFQLPTTVIGNPVGYSNPYGPLVGVAAGNILGLGLSTGADALAESESGSSSDSSSFLKSQKSESESDRLMEDLNVTGSCNEKDFVDKPEHSTGTMDSTGEKSVKVGT